MSVRRAYFATVSLSLLLVSSCGTSDWHVEPSELTDSALKIEVFWSSSDSEQQYSPIKAGAEAAEKTPTFQRISKDVRIQLDERKDPDTPEEAASIARTVRLDPSVLAVVGHSGSATTRAALPFYAEAGIPVLMPAATSPYLLYQFDEREPWPDVNLLRKGGSHHRFANAFRLIPSDVPDQVHAIELTIQELNIEHCSIANPQRCSAELAAKIHKPKVMVICDTTKRTGSSVYTRPMCDSIRNREDQQFSKFRSIASYKEVDLDTGDIYAVVTEIHAVNPDYIVLLGYSELARDVLEELKERPASGQEMSHYTFVMSEACLTRDLVDFGSLIYVTSPYNHAQTPRCSTQLSVAERMLTYESYAFDAVMILADAANNCKAEGVGRRCVMQYLRKNHINVAEACEDYHIDNGERQDAPYHVYSTCDGDLKPRWSTKADDSELHEHAGWCKGSNK